MCTSNQIAQEIMDYLNAHPNVCDTSDGIAHWWIHRQRLYWGLEQVQQALDQLENQGLINRKVCVGGSVIYSLNHDVKGKG